MKKFTVDDEQAKALWEAGVYTGTALENLPRLPRDEEIAEPDRYPHPTIGQLIWWLEIQGKYDWPRYLYNINYHPDDNELINELVDLCLEWAKE